MDRYESLEDYYTACKSHPGFPSDYATIYHEGYPYRVMVMSDSHDIVLERVGVGAVQSLGPVAEPEVVDALLDPVWARHELAETQLTLTEVVAILEERPADAHGEQELLAVYRERQEQADELIKEARRASYAVVAVSSLPRTPTDALHRRDTVDYGGADWEQLSRIAANYLKDENDPLDSFAVRSFGCDAGLSAADINWLESLFVDPIALGEAGYVNGRHRSEACRAAGVTHLVVDTRAKMPAARRQALLVRAGAPVLTLTPLDAAGPVPSPDSPSVPGLAL